MQLILFLIIFFVIRAVIRSKRAPQKQRPGSPTVKNAAPQRVPPVRSGEGMSTNTYYNTQGTATVKAVDPSHHHHKENVVVQAEGYAGEGDPARYHEREICVTDQYNPAMQDNLFDPQLDDETLRSAIIWSEILGKPKALQHHNGGMIS